MTQLAMSLPVAHWLKPKWEGVTPMWKGLVCSLSYLGVYWPHLGCSGRSLTVLFLVVKVSLKGCSWRGYTKLCHICFEVVAFRDQIKLTEPQNRATPRLVPFNLIFLTSMPDLFYGSSLDQGLEQPIIRKVISSWSWAQKFSLFLCFLCFFFLFLINCATIARRGSCFTLVFLVFGSRGLDSHSAI